mmetsp:Transcript_32534/g.93682  ORF Transcript_32534/g.93682 Transcript_32534/m.93682 type:complete len:202 (-) Transcript_32534:99-704(-)|eukprot:CAMPEP_0177396882 /NCGR_PEP_ID=MMETSP0368-20130122/57000_1 /TAXON_ID=447022 ORGANISM="Scrippsiella hangoei-like, Strain SHHI-4" /NCGR_SAMPLE_ID=MMETSP0368 /ASSEMBLY_ACC=CAM_ASM_000363 /LENGTH=201 /DNA_ID=CAMNT_0018863719 /DNA_START=48 /DNA_END=653 /DNA_ORIENTATION=+
MGGISSCYGSQLASADDELALSASPVLLHIYDVAPSSPMQLLNRLLSVWGTGAFHAGVEVYQQEWGFGGCGIYSCMPLTAPGHAYHESVPIGETKMTQQGVQRLLRRLHSQWRGSSYDLLQRNCCHFADILCRELTGLPAPAHIKSLALTGIAVQRVASQALPGTSAGLLAGLAVRACGSGSCDSCRSGGIVSSLEKPRKS